MAKTVRTSGAYTLEPGTEVVALKNGLAFTPVAFANLPSSPANGMVAFLTTDGAGATKNKLCYYETTNNRWSYVVDDSAVATSLNLMRYKEIDINIKAIPDAEDEAILNQLIGNKKASVSTDSETKAPADDNSDNPGKVASDDPTTVASVYPLQQELELKKQEAGKDLAQFDHINQDADESETDQEARKDEPLVKQPEVTGGENPGVPAELKKEVKNESEFVQRLKQLSGL